MMPCGAGRAAPCEFLGIGEGGSKQRGIPTAAAIGATTLPKMTPKSFSICGAQITPGPSPLHSGPLPPPLRAAPTR